MAAFILMATVYLGGRVEVAAAVHSDSGRTTDPLIMDVDWLNEIVARYEAAGGWFGELDSAQLVISRLSYAFGDYGVPLMGGGSSGVKLVPVLATQPPPGSRWAFWNVITRRFDLWRGPAPEDVGIITHFKRRMGGAPIRAVAATTTQTENSNNVVAVKNSAATVPPASAVPPKVRPAGISHAWEGGSARSAVGQLQAPQFDPPGGRFAPGDYKLRVRLTNPNPDGAGEMFYSIDSAGWHSYRGEALVVGAGAEVLAFCESADAAAHRDSDPVSARYTLDPIRLQLSVKRPAASVPASALSFAATPSPLLPRVAIANLDALPDELRGGGYFQILWTIDGSDPLTSATAFPVDAGRAGEAQPLPLSTLLTGDATALRIRIAARSSDRRLLLDSEETEVRLEITQ